MKFQSAARILSFPKPGCTPGRSRSTCFNPPRGFSASQSVIPTVSTVRRRYEFQSAARILSFPKPRGVRDNGVVDDEFQSAARILSFPKCVDAHYWGFVVLVSIRRADSQLPKGAPVLSRWPRSSTFQSAARILSFPKGIIRNSVLLSLKVSIRRADSQLPKEYPDGVL